MRRDDSGGDGRGDRSSGRDCVYSSARAGPHARSAIPLTSRATGMDRRRFLRRVSEAAAATALARFVPAGAPALDRRALVARHAPVVRAVDPFAPLSLGNGAFAFTADVTGLQSFPDAYAEIPLAT